MDNTQSYFNVYLAASHVYQLTKIAASNASVSSVIGHEAVVGYNIDSDTHKITIIRFSITDSVSGSGAAKIITDASEVIRSSLRFYYYDADSTPIGGIEFIQLSIDPDSSTGNQIFADILSQESIGSVLLSSPLKNILEIDLNDSLSEQINDALTGGGQVSVAIRRNITLSTNSGQIKIGALLLAKGTDTEWSQKYSVIPSDPPALNLSVVKTVDIVAYFNLRYTSIDPTSEQSSPKNSLGGYSCPNPVSIYNNTGIKSSINNTQTNIAVLGELPQESNGLIQIGPEIIKYEGYDVDNNQLNSITRKVSPNYSFPADPLTFGDIVYYIDQDKIFDTKPKNNLVSYRCLSVVFKSSTHKAELVSFRLISNDTDIDIGLEVPLFNKTTATITTDVDSGESLIYSNSTSVSNFESNFFKGAHIIIDPLGIAFESFIMSYHFSESRAEIILTDTCPDIPAGTSFIINAAPAQTIQNETISPSENSGRFFGFLSENGANQLDFNGINSSNMNDGDVVYVWIRQSHTKNRPNEPDIGAVIMAQYNLTSI